MSLPGFVEPHSSRGFSLLELILVLGIITVFAAIAIPRYANATARYQADLTTRRIAQDIKLAQTRARARGTTQRIRIHPGTDEVIIYNAAGLDPQTSEYCTRVWDNPYNADITASSFAGDTVLMFDGWGDPDSGGYALLQVGPEQRRINVDPDTGEVTIE